MAQAVGATEEKVGDLSKARELLLNFAKNEKIPYEVVLGDPDFNSLVLKIADGMIDSKIGLNEIEAAIFDPSDDFLSILNLDKSKNIKYNCSIVLGHKLAESRLALENAVKSSNCNSLQLSVVVPMYNEQSRIAAYNLETNKTGQDFLRNKYNQLEWLFSGLDNKLFDFRLLFIDDGCPNKSGEIANNIINESDKYKSRCFVHYLQDLIDYLEKCNDNNDVLVKNFGDLKSTKDSRKGGAVTYGMYLASTKYGNKDKNSNNKHYIVSTDSDLSTNLGFIGNLMASMLNSGNNGSNNSSDNGSKKGKEIVCSIGARYGTPKSFLAYPDGLVIDYKRYLGVNRVRIVMRHLFRKLVIPSLSKIFDTQVGLKAFDASIVEDISLRLRDRKGSFDMELLLLILGDYGEDAVSVLPILFVEDFESSNFTKADAPGAYYYDHCTLAIDLYEKFVAKINPINMDNKDDIRYKGYNYLKTVSREDFETMCQKLESDVVPKDAFLEYNLTIDDILKSTPKQ